MAHTAAPAQSGRGLCSDVVRTACCCESPSLPARSVSTPRRSSHEDFRPEKKKTEKNCRRVRNFHNRTPGSELFRERARRARSGCEISPTTLDDAPFTRLPRPSAGISPCRPACRCGGAGRGGPKSTSLLPARYASVMRAAARTNFSHTGRAGRRSGGARARDFSPSSSCTA